MSLQTAFRTKLYQSIKELQKEVDRWVGEYNNERTHTGRYCDGETPMQTFLESKHLAQEKSHNAPAKQVA